MRLESDEVRVVVDEAGGDDQTGGVDDAPGPGRGEVRHRDDTVLCDGHIRAEPRRAGAIDDRAAFQEKVI